MVKKTIISPCDDPLIKIAKNEGIKAVPIKSFFKYRKLINECEKEGKEDYIKNIYDKDWQRDYDRSKGMASWTSTHAMFVFISFSYFVAGKILATKPPNS